MGKRSLSRWLWKGTFELEASPLPTWQGSPDGEDAGGAQDLLGRTASYLEELWRLADLAEEAEKRGEGESSAELRGIAKAMLPVLDALDRVLEFGRNSGIEGEEFQNWLEAVGGVCVRLNRVLERMGLTPISSVGTEVDLAIHDVVATVRNNNYPENTVVEERQKGYYFRGRLLRDAKVVVALSH